MLTHRLAQGAQLLGMPLLDHVVVAVGDHFSFAANGLLPSQPAST